ncbi:uncharacterized protein LOC135481036 [Liolophura sinensis]|uniref:uncharacterized protein LOC135481036 n=1 Tax=Liolophura sinensis TaxID=3198878 RepID=UPI003158321C
MTLVFLTAVLTVLLTSPAALGFRMVDLFRSSRQSVKSPAGALVGVIMQELDADNDSTVSLSELGHYVDTKLGRIGPNERTTAEAKGYILTLGSLVDVDNNGAADKSELERATSLLVSLAGDIQVGRVLDMLLDINGHRVDMTVSFVIISYNIKLF